MIQAREHSMITLTFGQPLCRELVHELSLLSHRVKQVDGVESVVTRLDPHGLQKVVIYSDRAIEQTDLLRRMAAALRAPLAVTENTANTISGPDPWRSQPNPVGSIIHESRIVIQTDCDRNYQSVTGAL